MKYNFDSTDANIAKIVALLIFRLAILFENIKDMEQFLEFKKIKRKVAIDFVLLFLPCANLSILVFEKCIVIMFFLHEGLIFLQG
jgi:hypothetical protein